MKTSREARNAGDPDRNFGEYGVVEMGRYLGFSRSLSAQGSSDGGVFVLAQTSTEGYWLCKLTDEGALDTRFANRTGKLFDGTVLANFAALHLWDDKPTVIAAEFNRLMITRYQPDGELDTTFGQGGRAFVPLAGEGPSGIPGYRAKLTTATDDDYWYVAFTASWDTNGNLLSVVVRLNKDGTLDTGFDGKGFTVIDLAGQSPNWNMPVRLAVQQQGADKGKVLVLVDRRLRPTEQYPNFIVRLNADGSKDYGFGERDGVIALPHEEFDRTNSLVLDAADSFKVLGLHPNGDCLGLGYTSAGTVDQTFNNGELWFTPVGFTNYRTGWSGGISWGEEDAYRLLTWGLYSDRYDEHLFQLARVTQGCDPDPAFGIAGISKVECKLDRGFGEGGPSISRSPQGHYFICFSDRVIKVLGE